MKKQKRGSGKSTIERKEAKRTMPTSVISQKEEELSKFPIGETILPFAPAKVTKIMRRATKKEADPLLHDGLSQFERQLIQECREDGMSDSEIQQWLKEI